MRATILAVTAAALSAVLGFTSASAQEIRGPVKILTGFAAGGTSDTLARLVADKLGPRLGLSVIVENKPGASGTLAVVALKDAPPNGSTIMLANIVAMSLAPLIMENVRFDPLKDVAPILKAADFQIAVATGPVTGAQDLAGLLAWLKANPDKAAYGVPGIGSLPHLYGLRLSKASGQPFTVVPFRGTPPIATEILGGRLAMGLAGVADFAELHKAGQLRIVAASGTTRPPGLADVPTFRELGQSGLDQNGWVGFFAPPGTPAPIRARYNAEIAAVLRDPAVVERLQEIGFLPDPGTPEELRQLIETDIATWRPLIKEAGVKP